MISPKPVDTAHMLLRQLKTAIESQQRSAVFSAIDSLLAADVPIGDQWRLVARISRHDGQLQQARAAMERLMRGREYTPALQFEMAAFLADIGDVAEAQNVLRRLPPNFPDPATRLHFEGTLALNIGDLGRATDRFRNALRLRRTSGMTWLSLAEASRGSKSVAWTDEIIAASQELSRAPPTDRASFLYALGAAHDARGEYDQAFRAFSAGAEIVRSQRRYDRATDAAAVRQAEQLSLDHAAPTIATGRPIFIFGPPRSGTTLVEQIVASHSTVAGGGEMGLFDLVARDIGGLTGAHLDAAIERIGIDVLARSYLDMIAARYGNGGRVIDKTLTTTRLAGLVASVLPDAPLVWVRRDPLDNAWSCFRTFFAQGLDWSWDLTDIAHHLALESQLLDTWRTKLGRRLLIVDYETLVQEPERTISSILSHCGLSPEPEVFAPHQTERAVVTASVAQVRAPINRKGIGVAEPYRRHLQPFIDAYLSAGGTID